eukprot:TRINITY_DN814_c0_g2_i1.p1 TRINITY_DN814_c0_g2~~TRINITY_DN814_c0_g2_i1.p1  ORF type:complete len:339 (+),score=132.90 TRINITY_DN814_c0_g2_i1:71-1018(+)
MSHAGAKKQLEEEGLAVVEGFCTKEECAAMMGRMAELIDAWDPKTSQFSAFRTDYKKNEGHVCNEYFFDSADKIRFFFEPAATGADGHLKAESDKATSIHKVGHGLHHLDPVFREYSMSQKVRDLVVSLGYKDPVLPQSMYIFKQPHFGDKATIHKDSTFLHTTPRCSCLGLWLALEDATLENGCLWGKPGSQHDGVRRLFVRNPEYFEQGAADAVPIVFEDVAGVAQNPNEGRAVEAEEEARALGFKPYPVKAGDLVLIHGEVDHMSFTNRSDKSRHSYQLHLIEGPSEGVTWSPRNWLQYKDGAPFPKLGGVA